MISKKIKLALLAGSLMSSPALASTPSDFIDNTLDYLGTSQIKVTPYVNTNTHAWDNTAQPFITTNIQKTHSRWFWNAGADIPTSNLHRPPLHLNGRTHTQYFSLPPLLQAIPLLSPAVENGLNRAVHRRLQKTAEYYKRVDDYERLKEMEALLNRFDELNQTPYDAILSDELYQARHDLGYFDHMSLPNMYSANDALTDFNPTMHGNMESVLQYFQQARQGSGVKIRAEVGYKTGDFEWRVGHQKQKIDGFYNTSKKQERNSSYSTMQWAVNDRLSYFNFITREAFENNFGVEGFDRSTQSSYHRISYAFNNETAVFVAGGKHEDGLFGKTKFFQAGAENCSTLGHAWNVCASLSYEDAKYDFDNDLAANVHYSGGFRTTVNARYTF